MSRIVFSIVSLPLPKRMSVPIVWRYIITYHDIVSGRGRCDVEVMTEEERNSL